MHIRHYLYMLLLAVMPLAGQTAAAAQAPRIVNFVNFVRENDYRIDNSRALLLDATRRELALLEQYRLPGTFLLQYDALDNPQYRQLFKTGWARQCDIGCWLEITQPQAEAAGLVWRGDHPWVSAADIAFTVGYTPAERRLLVDVYMKRFREVFGHYPRTVGSWYIDAYTLQYLYDKYHIVASCNCKDQVGTDGYTLWGGYWNQAYYPSRRNGYMPAQTREGQIPVPVFRMLGSDPIYQYSSGLGGNGQGVFTLEPVYGATGRNPQWVQRFMNAMTHQPCLAFSYVQAGQENAFTWKEIGQGLTMQTQLIADLNRRGQVRVQTLAQTGTWFRKHFALTPATTVAVLDDTRGEGRQTLWYNSRHYRTNLLVDNDSTFNLRDLHLFDEHVPSAYVDRPGQTSHFVLNTLPVVDGFNWSVADTVAGLRLVRVNDDASTTPVKIHGVKVSEQGKGTSVLTFSDAEGHPFTLTQDERGITLYSPCQQPWALDLTAAAGRLPFTHITPRQVRAASQGHSYGMAAVNGFFQRPTGSGHYALRIRPEQGRIQLDCTNPAPRTEPAGLNGNRFLTLCFMIRTSPWEVSRDVKLHPRDEYEWHTLESVKALREAFAEEAPGGRLTWGFTLNAIEDQRDNYRQIRQYVRQCHEKYGDEVSYFPGYFPAMYLPRERINREMSEAIREISAFVGGGYRPQCIMGGFLSSDNLKYLAEKENIHVAHAVIWSQHAIDGGGADGSVSYPYYPSTEHFCKPAQGKADFIDCVSLDGWTMDFICARQSGQTGHSVHDYNSRRGVGPIETYKGMGLDLGGREVMHTEGLHFDTGYELNGFGWVCNIWETQMYHEFGKDLMVQAMRQWIGQTRRRWPDVQFTTFGHFGELWRKAHPANDFCYRFFERGSGIADSYNNLEMKWTMCPRFRMATLRAWQHPQQPARVIDFTRYDLPAHEPADATPQHPHKDWSLMNVLNQKQTRPQDAPVLPADLPPACRELIRLQTGGQ